MATREELYAALRNADAAGDVEGARKLASYIQAMPSAAPAAPAQAAQPDMGLKAGLEAIASPEGKEMMRREATAFLSPLRGVKDVIDTGAELLASGYDKITGSNEADRVKAMNDTGKAEFAQDTRGSMVAPVGRIAGNIAATAPVGGALAAPVRSVAPRMANALASGGMTTGAAVAPNALARGGDLAVRMAGGAATGGVSAGLIDPEFTGTGAAVGAALPPVAKLAGAAGRAIGGAVRGDGVAPEVAELASRAKALGIDIPADRLVNSKPMNALASGLNYVPFSGRAATEARMEKQLTRAASRLIGQDSDNMAGALRKAGGELGAKFDDVLRNNAVNLDKEMLDGVADVFNTAQKELGSDGLKAISSQVDELIAKGAGGEIDGQAAYNIKRTLDRIGRRNAPEAYHALELKKVLMDALNRSLGPDGARAFAQTRQQYGNMLALEKIAKNGVEGDISVARLANLPNINNQPLQEIADIAAQFVKAREGQHGAMQRGVAALGVGGALGLPALGALSGGARATNMLLNSNALRSAVLNPAEQNALAKALANPELQQAVYRTAPAISAR